MLVSKDVLRKSLLVFLIFCLCLLCGCDIFGTENEQLLKAPKLKGELAPIVEVMEREIGKGYTLRYPSGGDRRSAVVLRDINRDGKDEAFAFYSKAEDDMNLMMINNKNGDWKFADIRTLTAGGVERIDFYDINGDGTDEILVGWEIHGSSEKQLAVYNFVRGKLDLILLQNYTAYLCCDLDTDGKGELFLQQLSTADLTNKASLYKLSDGKLSETASCAMDRNVKSVISQTVSRLSTGQNAIYIDELKSAGAITEVIFLSGGKLQNPLLDETSGENVKTERSAQILAKDVNKDELLEIPVSEEITSVEGSNEKCYYTKWSYFTGENLVTSETWLINQNDGFYLIFPETWVGKIAVFRDSEKRIRRFFSLTAEGLPAEVFAELRIVDISLWDSADYSKSDLTELCRNKKNVIVGKTFAGSGSINTTLEELKQIIYIIE